MSDVVNKPEPAVFLHDALVALQKSFRRLSERSSDMEVYGSESKEGAKAIIVGNVDFEMAFHGEVEGESGAGHINDRIRLTKSDEGIAYTLRGTIATDTRLKVDEPKKSDHEPNNPGETNG